MAKKKEVAPPKKDGAPKKAAVAKEAGAKAVAKPVGKSARVSWLDAKKQTPVIEEKARHLDSFLKAMADGRIEDSELEEQEARLVGLMKEVEPQLEDALHAKITQLLCELTAYDLMRMLHTMKQNRPKTVFRG